MWVALRKKINRLNKRKKTSSEPKLELSLRIRSRKISCMASTASFLLMSKGLSLTLSPTQASKASMMILFLRQSKTKFLMATNGGKRA